MRIVNREEFLKLPPGTVYAYGDLWRFGGWCIKNETLGSVDWYFQPLDAESFEARDSSDASDKFERSLAEGIPIAVDFELSERDGGVDQDAVFAILDRSEIKALIDQLSQCL